MKLRFFAGVVLFAVLIPTLWPALLAGDGWRRKPPEQWTEEDAREVLTDSPWAKRVKVRYLESPGRSGSSTQWPVPGRNPGGTTPPIGGPPVGGGGGPGGVRTASEIVVRWQSAPAVRLAFSKLGIDDPPGLQRAGDAHVIAALAVPEMGPDMRDADDSSLLNRLRDGARLLVGNKRSVIPERVRVAQTTEGLMVFFIFPKNELGPLPDEKLKLVARIGSAQISADFKPGNMKLKGFPEAM
jgi:hypothetical protein